MQVRFVKDDLDKLELDATFTAGYSPAIVKAFRRRMSVIRAAKDERDLRAMKSWHFEKLSGNREHQYSIRLNLQFRLILEIDSSQTGNTIVVVAIEDYR